MKVFAISLKEHTYRQIHIYQQLSKLDFPFEIIDAVNGANYSQEEIMQVGNMDEINKYPNWLNKRAIACSMSHKKVYQKIIDEDLKCALIVEDDIVINENISNIINECVENLYDDEVILFYYRALKSCYLSQQDSTLLKDKKTQLVYPIEVNNPPVTAGAYLISKKVAEKLIHANTPVSVAADTWKYFFEVGAINKLRIVYPRLVQDAHLLSTIGYTNNNIYAKLAYMVDKFKIPFINKWMVKKRIQTESEMSNFTFKDLQTEFKR